METKLTESPSSEKLNSMSLRELSGLLNSDKDYRANFELAQRIVRNNTKAVNFYLSVLSLPIISYIENQIIHRDIWADFYEFLSKPFNTYAAQPEWHKVDLYKGETCRLDSYTSLITTRHFCKVAEAEREKNQSARNLIDNIDYESILNCTAEDDSQEYEVGSKLWKAHKTFQSLCERDQLVLMFLEIEKMSALEAWPLLDPYIQPRAVNGMTSEEVKHSWTAKQKQNALSLIKSRAILHFINIFNSL